MPPDGAGEAMVTVPVELLPPATLFGFRLMELTAVPGVMVILPCTVLLPRVAVMVTRVLLSTNPLLVLSVKVALVAPAASVTVAGTIANVLLLLKPTVLPPAGGLPVPAGRPLAPPAPPVRPAAVRASPAPAA